ncbi:MAG TPA: hypothetical protein VLJ61_02895 [Pyrinomonadaceae bacterium]|nr:hypothetical protein [Pyrinomonadaceae bacterium]
MRSDERTIWEQFLDFLAAAQGTDGARPLVRLAVVGAFVLGAMPGLAKTLAQARKAGAIADAGVNKSAPKAEGAKVNLAPIKAFIARSRRLHEQGKLDLSKPQTIVVEGDRQEDGTLTNVQITGESASDALMRGVAQDFVSSVNDSHALAFLDDVSHMRMTFALDGEHFTTRTASDAPTEARAEELARGYRMMINFGRLAKRGTDEGAILNNMKVSSSGKQLLMNLDMPREQMGNILLRQITPH